ncbi:MAG: ABC transporter permease, partial [Elusimicrobiota bacterium]|nr:ABC transporter permease [Elusimicrobiota bacterium]
MKKFKTHPQYKHLDKMTEKNAPSIISKISKYIDTRTRLLIGSIILLSIALTFISPAFFTVLNFEVVLETMVILSVLAMGETFLLIGGEIDISLESVMTFVAVTVVRAQYYFSWYYAVILGLLAGAGWGAVNGFFTIKSRIPSFLVTLATMMAIRGFALLLTEYRSWTYPWGMIDNLFRFKITTVVSIAIFWMIGIVIVSVLILNRTRFGRRVYACGGNRDGSEMIGVPVKKTKFWSFVLMGLLTAIAACLILTRNRAADALIGEGY